MIAHVQTTDGLAVVDLEEEAVIELDPARSIEAVAGPALSLPLVVASAEAGSTIVAVVGTKPPLVVSHDSGRTWRESGRGLPVGSAVAISPRSPGRLARMRALTRERRRSIAAQSRKPNGASPASASAAIVPLP